MGLDMLPNPMIMTMMMIEWVDTFMMVRSFGSIRVCFGLCGLVDCGNSTNMGKGDDRACCVVSDVDSVYPWSMNTGGCRTLASSV